MKNIKHLNNKEKTMKLKLKEILELTQSLNEGGSPLQKLLNQDLPVVTAFDLVPLAEAIQKELERYESVRMPLLQKYGESKEDSNYYEIKLDEQESFFTEMNELLDREVALPDVKVKPDVLGDAKLSAADLIKLKRLIEN